MTLRNLTGPLANDATVAAARDLLANRLPRNPEQYAAGLYRNAGGRVTIGSGGTGVFSLRNPAGSGALITLTEFLLGSSDIGEAVFRLDATVNSPTTLAAWAPNRAVPGATLAQVQSGITGVTGGTALSPVYLLPADIPIRHDFVTTLAPGQSVAVLLTVPALATAMFYASATWIEEAL